MSYHPLLATLLPSADVAYLVPYGTLTGALDEHLFLFLALATKSRSANLDVRYISRQVV